MVAGPSGEQAEVMNETASPPPGAPAAGSEPIEERPPGVDTEHLRDYRALRRDRQDRKLAGVCGGLARHLDVDPTLVRVVFVVLTLFGAAGLLLYVALWVFVPEQGSDSALIPVNEGIRNVVVVVALVVALLIALPSGFDGDGGAFIGLLILGTLVAVVLLTRDSVRRGRAPAGTPQQPAAGAPEAGAGWQTSSFGGYSVPPAPTAPPGTPTYGGRPTPRRRGPLLFGLVLASVLLALGVLGMVDASGSAVPDAAYPALALAVIGAWLVVGAVFGRPGGVIALGLVAVVALTATSVVEPRFEGDRELVARPTTAAGLAAHYDVPAGRAEIDLRGIRDLESLDGRDLRVELNAGEIVLIVPDGLAVDLDAQVGAGGEISTPDGTRNGWGVEVDELVNGEDPRATLTAELDVAFGRIHVRSQ
jgi:phage shock protein PspC (stress-responsive transcriptional regulator)